MKGTSRISVSKWVNIDRHRGDGTGEGSSATPRPYIVPEEMSYETFCRFREYVTTQLGIKMPDKKKTMLQSRLQKRLQAVNMDSFDAYYDYVFSAGGIEAELRHMIDAITTNKTDFFREPKHFEYLEHVILPDLVRTGPSTGTGMFRFWSAGCSTGAEPYSLAMVLAEFFSRQPGFDFSILATDLSQRVLNEAEAGIYTEAMAAPVPNSLRRKYLLRSKAPRENRVRIVPELRGKVVFGRLNFMAKDYGLAHRMDVIFCRNVLIYFDHDTQEQVVNRLCRYLRPDGHLFVGHSESLNDAKVPLIQENPTIYRKKEMD